MRCIKLTESMLATGLVAFYLFISFFEPYLNALGGSYIKYLLILIIVVLVAINRFKINRQNIANYFIFWMLYKCASLLWTRDTTIFNMHFLTNLTSVIFLLLIEQIKWDKVQINAFITSMWIGSGLLGLLTLFSQEAYLGVSNRIVLSLFGQSIDPNNVAAFLAVGCAISLYRIANKNDIYLSIVVFLINAYALMLTGSRGGMLTVVAIGLVCIFYYLKSRKNKLLFIVLCCCLFCILNYIIQRYLPITIYERLFAFETYEGGSERTLIWANAIDLMKTNPLYFLFGSGWGAYFGYNGLQVMLHNTFLSILCDVGLIGSILFFLPIRTMTIYLWKRKELLPILLLVAAFVPSFFIEAINKRFFWNPIYILIVYYKWKKIMEKKEDKFESTIK